MRLVERDIELFKQLYLFGCMTTFQIARLFGMHIKICQRRLRKLKRVGYLESRPIPSTKPGKSQNLFYLGFEAASLLNTQAVKPRFTLQLSHQQKNTDLLIEIIHSFNESEIKCEILPEHLMRTANHGVEIIPDGSFMLEKDAKKALFLVENCAGTEIIISPTLNSDIETKIIKYADLFEDNNLEFYKEYFGNSLNRFRLLYITNSKSRLSAISSIVIEHDKHGFIWLTTLPEFLKSGILGNIWQSPSLRKNNLSIIG